MGKALAAVLAAGLCTAACANAAPNVVLGSAAFSQPYGEGWGSSRPAKIFNGGDPSGLVREIKWISWGGLTAFGFGVHAIFKPHGGYYSQPVLVELRAYGLTNCTASGPKAYSHLLIREPSRPDGPLGPWEHWEYAGKNLCRNGFG
jgi:hypothetical protein